MRRELSILSASTDPARGPEETDNLGTENRFAGPDASSYWPRQSGRGNRKCARDREPGWTPRRDGVSGADCSNHRDYLAANEDTALRVEVTLFVSFGLFLTPGAA
ncbi:hypothetical protein DPEC_G00100560 [Dallia pectoralis]|uniref:Uncharacterized protein n=1 Tax=Dallia pectoralis TaxID=75939 RepID=A0ACC2GXA7_DALPE|nr:hypothetical protein DPEC_G00100560 [Dallia pectoralis]